jgi:hypothetical protein
LNAMIIMSYIIISRNKTLRVIIKLLLSTSIHFALEAELLVFPAISVSFALRYMTEYQ